MASQMIMSCPVSVCSSAAGRGRVAAAAARPRPAAAILQRVRPCSRRQAASRQATCVRAVLDVTDATFEQEVLKSDLPVLVDFWATWCGPCKLVAPSMDWAEKEYAGRLKVVKVEADGNKDVIQKYKVYGLPCLIVFRDGQEVEGSHNEGAITRKGLVEYLEKHGVPATAKA